MTTAKVTRTIVATVKGKMEKEGARGPYLSVQVLRQGMQYPETLNCFDPKQLEHVKLNSIVSLILNRDGLKADKVDDGQVSSFWWSIAGVADSPQEATSRQEHLDSPPRDDAPPAATQHAGKGTPKTGPESPPPLPQALGACQNHAMAFIESGIIPVPEGRHPINFLWELRDLIYRGVNQRPYRAEHFCYQHEMERYQSKKTGAWGHLVEGADPCVEAQP